MFRLEAAGFPIVFHVHDEVICEVPIGVSSAEELGALMGQPDFLGSEFAASPTPMSASIIARTNLEEEQ